MCRIPSFPVAGDGANSPLKNTWGTFPTCLFFPGIWHVGNVPHFINGLLAGLPPQNNLANLPTLRLADLALLVC